MYIAAAIIIIIAALNAWTVLLFWADKQRAKAGDRRIPEATLLHLALLGGTPGAFLARQLFRHKTRKQPFSFYLILIATIQLGALLGLSYTYFMPA